MVKTAGKAKRKFTAPKPGRLGASHSRRFDLRTYRSVESLGRGVAPLDENCRRAASSEAVTRDKVGVSSLESHDVDSTHLLSKHDG